VELALDNHAAQKMEIYESKLGLGEIHHAN